MNKYIYNKPNLILMKKLTYITMILIFTTGNLFSQSYYLSLTNTVSNTSKLIKVGNKIEFTTLIDNKAFVKKGKIEDIVSDSIKVNGEFYPVNNIIAFRKISGGNSFIGSTLIGLGISFIAASNSQMDHPGFTYNGQVLSVPPDETTGAEVAIGAGLIIGGGAILISSFTSKDLRGEKWKLGTYKY